MDDDGHVNVVCKVGHSFEPPTLSLAQTETASRALWAAMRALEERACINQWILKDPTLHGWVDPTALSAQLHKDRLDIDTLRDLASRFDSQILQDREEDR